MTSSKPTSTLERVVRFVAEYGGIEYPIDEFAYVFPIFVRNNTFSIAVKDGEVHGVCIWNIDGDIADVLECVIHPEHRNTAILKYLALQGWRKFPYLKYFKFVRERKDKMTIPRVYELSKLLKGVTYGK